MKGKNKELFFFKHDYPQLDNHAFFAKNFALVMKVHSIWFLLGFIGFKYLAEMFSFDLTVIILFLVHRFITLPLMQAGKVPMYYRADYSKMKPFFIIRDLIVLGGFIRWFSYVGIIIVTTILSGLNSGTFFATIDEMQMHLLGRLDLNSGIALAIVAYVGYLFIMYYVGGELKISSYFENLRKNLSMGLVFDVAAKKACKDAQISLIKQERIKSTTIQSNNTVSLSQEDLSKIFARNQQKTQPIQPVTASNDRVTNNPENRVENKPTEPVIAEKEKEDVSSFVGRGPRQF